MRLASFILRSRSEIIEQKRHHFKVKSVKGEGESPLDTLFKNPYNKYGFRGVAKFGIALGSGPRGLGFESRHSDQNAGIRLCGCLRFLLCFSANPRPLVSKWWPKEQSESAAVPRVWIPILREKWKPCNPMDCEVFIFVAGK